MQPPAQMYQGLQVILQGPDGRCPVRCDGVYNVPSPNAAFVAIVPDPSAAAARDASALRGELLRRLCALPGARAESTTMPCGPVPHCLGRYYACALGFPFCKTTVVLVGDPSAAWSNWHGQQPGATPSEIVPLVPPGVSIGRLPAPLARLNIRRWSVTPTELVPEILAVAGISSTAARVFISYRVAEASALCEQLFDGLNRVGFDVFVDRFRIAVGADFQQRILAELAHKGMVVFLESKGILASKWTRYEAAVAKSARLGILAVHLPGGQRIPDIDARRRFVVPASAWNQRGRTVQRSTLEGILDRIRSDHALYDLRRRQVARDSMRRALQRAGVHWQQLLPTGAVEARARNGRSYVLWLPPRPAELSDFHHVATAGGRARATRTILAPASHMAGEDRQAMQWLATTSAIESMDESQINRKAADVAAGR